MNALVFGLIKRLREFAHRDDDVRGRVRMAGMNDPLLIKILPLLSHGRRQQQPALVICLTVSLCACSAQTYSLVEVESCCD